MLQVLGRKSSAKRQFAYSLAMLLAIHYGKYEVYSENFSQLTEDYSDSLTIHPLKDYCGQECMLEAENSVLTAEETIYYLTPYQPELKAFLKYLEEEKPQRLTIVFGEHIGESVLNKKYLKRLIEEKSEKLQYELLTVEWDKINKLLANEGLFDGYYQIGPLSDEYKKALLRSMEIVAGISPGQSKKYFRQERRLRR